MNIFLDNQYLIFSTIFKCREVIFLRMEAVNLSIKELKNELIARGVDISDCIEKSDLVRKYNESKPKVGAISQKSSIVSSLQCTEIQVTGEEGAPKIGLIILHGYGANRHDLFPIIYDILKSWKYPEKPSFTCLVPDGPLQLDQNSRAWFPLNFIQLISTPPMQLAENSLPGLDDATAKVQGLVDHLIGTGCAKLILGGFSQGAILSAHTTFSMSDPSKIAALALFSCAVQAREKWEKAAKGLRFFFYFL